MSELSPMDVLGASFNKRLNGYDPHQVHEFLSNVAGALERLARERGELRQQLREAEKQVAEFKQRENALQEALVAAQRSAEGTKENARQDAERLVAQAHQEGQRIVTEAQSLAQRIVEETTERVETIEGVLRELRGKRREARADLRRMVEILEGVTRDDERREQEEDHTPRLSLLDRRRQNGSGSGA